MSKIVSANRGFQAPRLRKSTVFGSRVGASTHSFRTRAELGPPPGPVIPEDAIFFAPLENDLKDYVNNIDGVFTRATVATYEKNGVWLIAGINTPAFGDNGFVSEPAVTNYCTNYNAAPETSLSGITPNGATVTALSSPAEIAAAGLNNLVPGGHVIRMENATGATVSPYIPSSGAGSYIYSISAWVNTFGVDCTYKFQTAGTSKIINTSGLERVFVTDNVGASDAMQWELNPGQVIHVIMNCMAQGPCPYNPVITTGATASKGTDTLTFDLTGIMPISMVEGMISIYLTNIFDQPPPEALRAGTTANEIMTLRPLAGTFLHSRHYAGIANFLQLSINEGPYTATISAPWTSYGVPAKCVGRWDNVNIQCSKTDDVGAWFDSNVVATTAPVTSDEIMRIRYDGQPANRYLSHEYSRAALFTVDKGIDWIKDNA